MTSPEGDSARMLALAGGSFLIGFALAWVLVSIRYM